MGLEGRYQVCIKKPICQVGFPKPFRDGFTVLVCTG